MASLDVTLNGCEGSKQISRYARNDRGLGLIYPKQAGFTLVEMITVIVTLSIIGVMSFGFVANTMDSYASTIARGKLVAKGRSALERMSRQIRGAAPNSVRVTGSCVEFLPVAGGGNYIDDLPDQANGVAISSAIVTAPHAISLWTARYVVVGALDETEIYDTQVSLANLQSRSSTSLTLSANKRWQRNSLSRRFYLTDNPQAFCVSAGDLLFYGSGYATPASSTGTPSGAGDLLAEGVTLASPFDLSSATEDRNATLRMALQFSEGGEAITLHQEVLIRNVP